MIDFTGTRPLLTAYATVARIRTLPPTRAGNPRWDVTVTDGATLRTGPGTTVGAEWIGALVVIRKAKGHRWVHLELADPPSPARGLNWPTCEYRAGCPWPAGWSLTEPVLDVWRAHRCADGYADHAALYACDWCVPPVLRALAVQDEQDRAARGL